jgi:hypothetical protein
MRFLPASSTRYPEVACAKRRAAKHQLHTQHDAALQATTKFNGVRADRANLEAGESNGNYRDAGGPRVADMSA